MIIIEAGSTHTKVCPIIDHKIGQIERYPGINPNYMTDEAIYTILVDCLGHLPKNTEVYYYGTGCASLEVQDRMKYFIHDRFDLSHVYVYSDLLASARATAQGEAGQINILGTGSASCIYDGAFITRILPNIGYLFGDHGSGYKIGYSLLQAYFDNLLDTKAQTVIESYSKMKKDVLLRYIYSSDSKSKIASYAQCAHQLKDHDSVNALISNEFETFINKQIKLNEDYRTYNQYFSGSIAAYFESELKNSLNKHDLSIMKICKDPIKELCKFHLTYSQ